MSESQNQPPALMDDEQRAQILAEAVGMEVAHGRRVESHTPHVAVVVTGQRVNHTLHAILSIFTCGLWVFVWAGLAVFGGETRHALTVDPYGRVTGRKL